jgi:hypothetical protein
MSKRTVREEWKRSRRTAPGSLETKPAAWAFASQRGDLATKIQRHPTTVRFVQLWRA